MNVNMNIAPTGMRPLPGAAETAAAASAQAAADKPALTVSDSDLPVLDGASSIDDVPDSALDRNDPLGRLIGEAFRYPPPPMPDLPTLD